MDSGTTAWMVGIASDFMVVGYNPESADMDNPRGEIIRERFYALAESASGDRNRWGCFETEEAAETGYQLFAPPIELWEETYPAYGSRAYEDYGQAEEIAWERKMDGQCAYA